MLWGEDVSMEIALQRVSILTKKKKPAWNVSDYTDCIINGKMASWVHCCFASFLFFHFIIFLIVRYDVTHFITPVLPPSDSFKNGCVVHACNSISCTVQSELVWTPQKSNYLFWLFFRPCNFLYSVILLSLCRAATETHTRGICLNIPVQSRQGGSPEGLEKGG